MIWVLVSVVGCSHHNGLKTNQEIFHQYTWNIFGPFTDAVKIEDQTIKQLFFGSNLNSQIILHFDKNLSNKLIFSKKKSDQSHRNPNLVNKKHG